MKQNGLAKNRFLHLDNLGSSYTKIDRQTQSVGVEICLNVCTKWGCLYVSVPRFWGLYLIILVFYGARAAPT